MKEHEKTATNGIFAAISRLGRDGAKGLRKFWQFAGEQAHYTAPILNGLLGERLPPLGPGLKVEMNLRLGGRDIAADGPELNDLLIGRARRLLVLAHGLMMDEAFWQTPAGDGASGFGPRLQSSLSEEWVVLYLRYNTGYHISHNGRALSEILERILRAYPGEIKEINILAHSMGGLVARSAGFYADQRAHAWVKKLRRVFLLGVPHDGAWLAQLGHFANQILHAVPDFSTNMVGAVAELRSDGLKDLRAGYLTDNDWQIDPATGRSRARTPVPPLDDVEYHILAGTLTPEDGDPESLVRQYLGDGLVGEKSATAMPHRREDPTKSSETKRTRAPFVRTFTGAGHLALTRDARVFAYILDALSAPPKMRGE